MKEFRRRSGVLQTIAAFCLGTVAGSIVTLLYAPTSGRVIRRRLALRARAIQRETLRRVGRTGRVLVNKAGTVRNAAGKWISHHLPRNGKQVLAR